MMSRVAIVALSVALSWLLGSAASRGQGIYPFLAGAFALAAALWAHSRGRRAVLYGFLYLQILLAAAVLVLESTLHLWPGILRGPVANVAYTGYHWQKGGIYFLDPHRGPVLRASFRRSLYWSGHWWQHQTNADAYRGPRLAQADAIFAGDSMIYGHGVEEPDTVSARFTARTGRTAANLGQQGTCLLQTLLTLRVHGPRLRPRVVYVCAHFNDLEEVIRYYDEADLRRFLDSPQGAASPPLAREEYRPQAPWNLREVFARDLALPLRVAGIPGALARSLRDPQLGSDRGPRDPFVPTPEEIGTPLPALFAEASPEERLPWLAERRAVAEIKALCDTLGASLVLFDLGYPESHSRAIEALAGELGVAYSRAGRVVLERSRAREAVYLADDGHWSGSGASVVAEELARDTSRTSSDPNRASSRAPGGDMAPARTSGHGPRPRHRALLQGWIPLTLGGAADTIPAVTPKSQQSRALVLGERRAVP